MACEISEDKLVAFLEGRLGGSEAATVEATLESCSECMATLEKLTARSALSIATPKAHRPTPKQLASTFERLPQDPAALDVAASGLADLGTTESMLEGRGLRAWLESAKTASGTVSEGDEDRAALAIEREVQFGVYPPKFARAAGANCEVVFDRAYVATVEGKKTAVFRYKVGGKSLNVLITDELPSPASPPLRSLKPGDVKTEKVDDQHIPLRRLGNWTYVFVGDLSESELCGLAASAHNEF